MRTVTALSIIGLLLLASPAISQVPAFPAHPDFPGHIV